MKATPLTPKAFKALSIQIMITAMLILSSHWASAQGNPPPQGAKVMCNEIYVEKPGVEIS